MEITLDEFKLLRKLYRGGSLALGDSTSRLLLRKKLVRYVGYAAEGKGSGAFSYEIEITDEGKLAYERYHSEIYDRRMTSIRSWAAIIISALSLIVSVIALLYK